VPDTPGQTGKLPMVIPVAWGLLDAQGTEVAPTRVHALTAEEDVISFETPTRPVLSLLRGFSAPVIVEHAQPDADRLTLLASDTDPFVRWEAGRMLAKDRLIAMIAQDKPPEARWLAAMADLARDEDADPAFRALALALPSEDDLAQTLHAGGIVPDPDAIHAAREAAGLALARELEPHIAGLRAAMRVPGPYDPRAEDAGRRALDATLLRLMTRLDGGEAARGAWRLADNMTDRMAAFACLLEAGDPDVAAAFEADWSHDRLVMDKWFSAQVVHAAPERAVGVATGLTRRPDFAASNPNRFRAVIGALSTGNPTGFHRRDGSGYRFLADWLLMMDAANPQTAARMSTAFETWRRYDADRQDLIVEQLDRIAGAGISGDLAEMVGRMRGA
jgi:aminopeptidase N